MLRSFSALLSRHAALATSVALHVSAVAAGGHALLESTDGRPLAGAPMQVEIELADARVSEAAPALEQPAPPARTTHAKHAGHRHSYPTPRDHDERPHDPSIVHVFGSSPAIVAPPPAAETSVERPLHFVLAPEDGPSPERGATRAALGAHAGLHADGGATGSVESASGATFAESAVDAKARLLSSVPVVYPEAARAAEREADVRLELVVDSEGRVASAHPLAQHGLGLDEAARRAVSAYRFSPARRAGRPVRVRMEWTVAFRLE